MKQNNTIIYLDPPYNNRQYSSNYSPLNYIAQYKDVILTGKTGLIASYNRSAFCRVAEVKNAMIKLIDNCLNTLEAMWIILSYNNEGLLTVESLKEILEVAGNIILYKIKYNKFKSQKKKTEEIEKINAYVYEYVWAVDCSNVDGKFEEIEVL